jgi:hypothetical protein
MEAHMGSKEDVTSPWGFYILSCMNFSYLDRLFASFMLWFLKVLMSYSILIILCFSRSYISEKLWRLLSLLLLAKSKNNGLGQTILASPECQTNLGYRLTAKKQVAWTLPQIAPPATAGTVGDPAATLPSSPQIRQGAVQCGVLMCYGKPAVDFSGRCENDMDLPGCLASGQQDLRAMVGRTARLRSLLTWRGTTRPAS